MREPFKNNMGFIRAGYRCFTGVTLNQIQCNVINKFHTRILVFEGAGVVVPEWLLSSRHRAFVMAAET